MTGGVRGANVSGAGLDVGFLTQGWAPDPGGVETVTAELARELAQLGHRVHVLALDSAEGLEPYSISEREIDGVGVRRMAYRYHDHRVLGDLVQNRRANDVVLAWMAEVPCDLIHVHHATGFGAGALDAIADVGNPLVVSLHDYWTLCPRGQMFRVDGVACDVLVDDACARCIAATWPKLLAADDAAGARSRSEFALAALARAHLACVPSPSTLEIFARAGLAREKLRVVEYGVDGARLAAEVAAERARSVRTDRELRIGVLGALYESKGVLAIARAFTDVRAPELALEFHGPDWSYHGDRRALDELARIAALDARIRILGEYRRDELARVLARLDAVAAPSLWHETFGLSVREARAAGLWVFVSDRGALASATLGGGEVVAAGDHAAWVRALERWAREHGTRTAAPFVARSPRDMALEYETLYRDAIRAATQPRSPEPNARQAPSAEMPSPQMPSAEMPKSPRGFWRRFFGG